VSIGGGIGEIYGGRRIGLKDYSPSRAFLREMIEQRAGGDVRSLYGPDAYRGPGLGYAPETMEARLGQGGDTFAAARAGEEQRLTDLYRRTSGGGALPGSYFRGMQRARSGELGRRAAHLRDVLISDEEQRREDLLNRLNAALGLGGKAAGLREAAQARRYAEIVRSRQQMGEGIGDVIGGIATFGVGGGGGG
jgi:hypothetical protein